MVFTSFLFFFGLYLMKNPLTFRYGKALKFVVNLLPVLYTCLLPRQTTMMTTMMTTMLLTTGGAICEDMNLSAGQRVYDRLQIIPRFTNQSTYLFKKIRAFFWIIFKSKVLFDYFNSFFKIT